MKQKKLREDVIHIKMREISEGVSLVLEYLPPTVQEFRNMGLVKDGIYKRIEFAVEDVFDICAIIDTDPALGMPGEDADILEHLTGVTQTDSAQKFREYSGNVHLRSRSPVPSSLPS